jgi:hypothetical protein
MTWHFMKFFRCSVLPERLSLPAAGLLVERPPSHACRPAYHATVRLALPAASRRLEPNARRAPEPPNTSSRKAIPHVT